MFVVCPLSSVPLSLCSSVLCSSVLCPLSLCPSVPLSSVPMPYLCPMTRYLKWAGILAAMLLIYVSFLPWVHIVSKNITVSGMNSEGTNFGKPGYFHWIMSFFFILFSLIPKVWAKRFNLLIVALNLGWAIRNYLLISACEMGECPVKKPGIYFLLFLSVFMMICSFFPDIKLKKDNS